MDEDDVIEEGADYDDDVGSEHTSATDSDGEEDPEAEELDLEGGGCEDGWHDEDEDMEDDEHGDEEGTDEEGEDDNEEMVWEVISLSSFPLHGISCITRTLQMAKETWTPMSAKTSTTKTS